MFCCVSALANYRCFYVHKRPRHLLGQLRRTACGVCPGLFARVCTGTMCLLAPTFAGCLLACHDSLDNCPAFKLYGVVLVRSVWWFALSVCVNNILLFASPIICFFLQAQLVTQAHARANSCLLLTRSHPHLRRVKSLLVSTLHRDSWDSRMWSLLLSTSHPATISTILSVPPPEVTCTVIQD